MIRNLRRAAIAAVLSAAVAVPLLAAPADTIKARQAGFKELGAAFKAANDGLRAANVAAIQAAAPKIVAASRAQYNWFPRGTGPSAGVKTGALPVIWTQAADFRAKQDAFAAAAASYQRAAATGNTDAITAEARKLGGTCKACHDTYRSKD